MDLTLTTIQQGELNKNNPDGGEWNKIEKSNTIFSSYNKGKSSNDGKAVTCGQEGHHAPSNKVNDATKTDISPKRAGQSQN